VPKPKVKIAKTPAVQWKQSPDDQDYPAAASYLALLCDQKTVTATVAAFRQGTADHFKAKDILRASGLPALPLTNPHVASDLDKVRRGVPLSPVLLVRGQATQRRPALIADGYHRICASYETDEDTDVPVIIVDLPDTTR
jgi:hypothetical protein